MFKISEIGQPGHGEDSVSLVVVKTCLHVAIALTALLGNVSVLYVFYKTPRLRTVTSYYIITLAIADILMAVMVMPISIAIAISGCGAVPADIGKVTHWIYGMLNLGSLQTTTLIAINRYFCVVKPAKYRKYFKPKIAILMIVACWITTTCLSITIYTTNNLQILCSPELMTYFVVFDNHKLFVIYMHLYQIGFVILPSLVNIICYWKIYKHVTNHNAGTAQSLNATSNAARPIGAEEAHLTRSMMALVIGFTVCWIPHSTLVLCTAHTWVPREVVALIAYCAFISSALNPVLYNIFNRPFRKRFKEITTSRNVVAPETSRNTAFSCALHGL